MPTTLCSGDEHCGFCLQSHAAELVVHCEYCDRPGCAFCVVSVRRGAERLCAACAKESLAEEAPEEAPQETPQETVEEAPAKGGR